MRRFQIRISALIVLIAVAALVLAVIHDMPRRFVRDDYARREPDARAAAERYRRLRDLCLQQPEGTIHRPHDEPLERLCTSGKRLDRETPSTCADKAKSWASCMEFHLKGAEFDRVQKAATQRQLIFPWSFGR